MLRRERPSERERHQQRILADFQEATRNRDRARALLAEAQHVAQVAEADYDEDRKRLRRVYDDVV